MKIMVAVKRVADHNVRVRVADDHSGVDLRDVKMSVNPFCAIAVEKAVQLKEAGQASEVIVVSVGEEKARDQLQQALAMGADKAVLVRTDSTPEPLHVARILKVLAEQHGAELILTGKLSVDGDHNQTGQMLAALMNIPQACCAAELSVEGGTVQVCCEADQGIQRMELPLPALVTADLRLAKPRFIKLPALMKAKKKPLDVLQAADLVAGLTPHTRILSVEPPAATSRQTEVMASAESLADVIAQKMEAL